MVDGAAMPMNSADFGVAARASTRLSVRRPTPKAVSVLQMARGARLALAADVGLSVSGIAGPGGGTMEKPVGTTWVGLSTPYHEESQKFVWDQDRIGNKMVSAEAALQLLVDYLRRHQDGKD